MIKTKALLALAALAAVLAVSATPALAEFISRNGTSQGPAQLLAPAILTVGAGQPPLVCEELGSGLWKIRTKTGQAATSKGPHLNISGQFTKCVAVIGEGITTPASVNAACELQVAQIGTSGTAVTGSVAANCVVSIPALGCLVTVPTKGNTLLTKATLSKIGTNLVEVNAAIGSITNEISEGCVKAGLKNGTGKEATFSVRLQAHEITFV